MGEVNRQIQLKNSKIPKLYLIDKPLTPDKPDLESYKRLRNIETNVVDFVKEGNNLFLGSNFCGNGKTSWSCRIGKAFIDQYAKNFDIDYPVLFINVPEMINLKKSAITDTEKADQVKELERALLSSYIVIWDDIATKMLSEYDREYLYIFINNRVTSLKTNIYTSNSLDNKLFDLVGARLYSRIINTSVNIILIGSDNRKVISKKW